MLFTISKLLASGAKVTSAGRRTSSEVYNKLEQEVRNTAPKVRRIKLSFLVFMIDLVIFLQK